MVDIKSKLKKKKNNGEENNNHQSEDEGYSSPKAHSIHVIMR